MKFIFSWIIFIVSVALLLDPDALFNRVWLNNGLYCGIEGKEVHTDMLFVDVTCVFIFVPKVTS
jgi:hypothetical protein